MIRFLLDEHIPAAVLRHLQRVYPDRADVVCVVDVGFKGAGDPAVLAWAAVEGRILISRDKATLTDFAFGRINRGLPMPGVVTLTRALPLGRLLEELALIIECGKPDDFENVVYYLP